MQDLRLAVRSLRATPVVTAVAILSLALGIGANASIFSIINALMLRSLAVKSPERLALMTDTSYAHVRSWSYPVWREIHQRPELFAQSGAWSYTRFNVARGGEAQLLDGMYASGSLFETLGVSAVLGRTFSEIDDRVGGGPEGPVGVISSGLWQRQFGGAPDVIGRSVTLDDVSFTVVGVMPPDFSGPEIGRRFDVIVPLGSEPLIRGRDSFLNSSGTTFLTIIARLKPDHSMEAATSALRRLQPQIREATLAAVGPFGSRAAMDRYLTIPFVLVPGATGYAGARDLRQYGRPLYTILAIVVLLLLVACVNVAHILIARAIARQHELSVRIALGASRGRLVRDLLLESAMLGGVGATLGVVLTRWVNQILVAQISTPDYPVFLDVGLDRRVLLFTLLVAALTTVVFGTAPAIRAGHAEPIDALKQPQRSISGGRRTLTGWWVAVQVSLSLILVVAAGLFVRTFTLLRGRPLGFEPNPVLIVTIDAHRTNPPTQRQLLYERARDAVRRLPDVADAALSLTTPVAGNQFTPRVEIEGVTDTQGPVWSNLVSPGWFATYGTPLIAGRDLTDRDRAGTQRIAVVNQAFARKFANGPNVIGRMLTLYPGTPRAMGPIEIVGIVADAVHTSLRAPAPPTYYLPFSQFDYLMDLGIRSISLSVRLKTGSPLLVEKPVTAALATVNPQLTLTFRPLRDQVDASLTQERLLALLAGCFGGLGLLLAAIGLYGVTAYAVASRRGELGIRMALGAVPAGVIRLVMSHVALLVGVGLIIGAVISAWASKFVAPLLYGVEPRDPVTLIGAAAILAAVGAVAGWLPAWRASRIDPAEVLRES